MVGTGSETSFGMLPFLTLDAVIDWLIKWVQLTPAFDHNPVLNRFCLRIWTQLTYFLSFPTISVWSLYFAMSRVFLLHPVSKTPRNVSTISYWPSYSVWKSGEKNAQYRCILGIRWISHGGWKCSGTWWRSGGKTSRFYCEVPVTQWEYRGASSSPRPQSPCQSAVARRSRKSSEHCRWMESRWRRLKNASAKQDNFQCKLFFHVSFLIFQFSIFQFWF